jgi:hypothetical protein
MSDGNLRFRVHWNGTIYLDDSSFKIDNDLELGGGTLTQSNIKAAAVDGSGGNITADGWIRAKGGLYGDTIGIKHTANGKTTTYNLFNSSGKFVNDFYVYDGSNNVITLAKSTGTITARALEIKNSSGTMLVNV